MDSFKYELLLVMTVLIDQTIHLVDLNEGLLFLLYHEFVSDLNEKMIVALIIIVGTVFAHPIKDVASK